MYRPPHPDQPTGAPTELHHQPRAAAMTPPTLCGLERTMSRPPDGEGRQRRRRPLDVQLAPRDGATRCGVGRALLPWPGRVVRPDTGDGEGFASYKGKQIRGIIDDEVAADFGDHPADSVIQTR